LLHTFCFPLHKPTVSIIMQEIPDKGYVHVKRKTRH
jgi:predicted transcriptional regulator